MHYERFCYVCVGSINKVFTLHCLAIMKNNMTRNKKIISPNGNLCNNDGFKFLSLLGCILLHHNHNGPKQCIYFKCSCFLAFKAIVKAMIEMENLES